MYLPDNPERSIADGPVRLYVQLRLQVERVLLLLLLLMMMVVLLVLVVVSFPSSGRLDLGGSRSGCRSGSLSQSRRREVGLLLAGVEHHCSGSSSRGAVLLHRVHGGGGARVLQVMLTRVVVVMHVGRWKVLELVVVMRVMGSYCRGATVVSSHHFWNICSRCAAKSHSMTRQKLPLSDASYLSTDRTIKNSGNVEITTPATLKVWVEKPLRCASSS